MKRLFYKVANQAGATITKYTTERSPEGCQMYTIEGKDSTGDTFHFWDSYWIGCLPQYKLELIELFKTQCLSTPIPTP